MKKPDNFAENKALLPYAKPRYLLRHNAHHAFILLSCSHCFFKFLLVFSLCSFFVVVCLCVFVSFLFDHLSFIFLFSLCYVVFSLLFVVCSLPFFLSFIFYISLDFCVMLIVLWVFPFVSLFRIFSFILFLFYVVLCFKISLKFHYIV